MQPQATLQKPELRQATVMFADIVGFTAMSAEVGPEQAYMTVTGCLRLLDGIIRKYGGSVDKYLGDCLMAVFGYPVPVEDPAPAAAHAAWEMRERVEEYNREFGLKIPLRLVVGINTGPMVAGDISGPVIREFHVLGDAVNVAARMKAKAPLGQIFVGPDTYERTRDSFRYRVLEPIQFKGKSEPIPTFELLGTQSEGTHGPLNPRAVSHSALIGRTAELEALRSFARRLQQGQGEGLLVLGEEGSGKSRLLAELGNGTELTGVAILQSSARPAERERDFALAADLLAVGAEGTQATKEESFRSRLESALVGRAGEQPVLVVVDDLQWADPASLELLRSLLPLASAHPISFLFTLRPEFQEGCGILQPLQASHPERCHEIRLDELEPDQRRLLVEGLAVAGGVTDETRALIDAKAGGNPKRIIMATFLASALRSESDPTRQAAERSGDAERRRATILFADISGFTAMTEKLGAEQSYPIVAGCLRLLDEIARKHGGTVDKYLGDCVLALFGVPEAIEDAPRAAVNAAIEMRRRVKEYNEEHGLALPLDVHSGINTGLGIAGDISGPLIREFTVMGDPVTVADQLKDLAPNGRIYLGDEAHRFTRDVFEFRPVEDLQLKGRDERIPAFELLSREEHLYRARIGSERQVFSALVGREQELETLRASLAELASERGGIVSLIAEAGIGKSRLVSELASSPEAGSLLWLEGRSLSTGQQLSLHPFADLSRAWAQIGDEDDDESARAKLLARVRELAPQDAEEHFAFMATVMGMRLSEQQRALLDRIQGDALEKRIQRSVFDLLRAESARQPVVVALDDLHWADQSSLELLETLLRLAADCPILFLNMSRPGFATTSGRILDFVREHHDSLHIEIPLHPLDGRAARSLINNLFKQGDIPYETRRLIEQKAQGNPFYIEEVVRSLVDEGAIEYRDGAFLATEKIHDVAIPGTVQEVVMARIDRLEPAKKQLLQVASVVGESFHREILMGVQGEEAIDEDVGELRNAEFIVSSDRMQGIEYAFKHPLIREVTYDGILHARREELHLAVGNAIESRMPEDISGFSAMLAYHFSLGRDAERAEEYVFRAGDEAAGSAASSEALQFFRQASKLYLDLHGEGGDPAKRARLHKNIARALFNRGELVEAVEAFNQAVEALGERVARSQLAIATRFTRNLSTVLLHLYWTHRWQRPAATENQRELIELMYERSMCEVTADATRFLFDSFETLALLLKVDLASVYRSGLMYSAASLIFSFGGISFGLASRVLRVARPAVLEEDAPELFIYRASGFVRDFFAGTWGEDRRISEELLRENLGYGRIWDVLSYLCLETDQRISQGDFAGARERIELNDKIWDQYQNDLAKSQHYFLLTRLLIEQRRLEEALRQADAYYEENPEELLHVHAFGFKAQIQVLAGDLEGAEQTLTRCAELMKRLGELTIAPYMRSQYHRSRLLLDVTLLEQAVAGGASRAPRRLVRRTRRSVRRALRSSAWVAARQPEVYRLTGLFHWHRGSRRRALAWWRRSRDAARALGARPELARTQRELGVRLLEGAAAKLDPAEPQEALREARASFEALGLEWDLACTPLVDR